MSTFDWKDPTTVPLNNTEVWLWVSLTPTDRGERGETILHAKFLASNFIGGLHWTLQWDGYGFDGNIVAWDYYHAPNKKNRPFAGIDVKDSIFRQRQFAIERSARVIERSARINKVS